MQIDDARICLKVDSVNWLIIINFYNLTINIEEISHINWQQQHPSPPS